MTDIKHISKIDFDENKKILNIGAFNNEFNGFLNNNKSISEYLGLFYNSIICPLSKYKNNITFTYYNKNVLANYTNYNIDFVTYFIDYFNLLNMSAQNEIKKYYKDDFKIDFSFSHLTEYINNHFIYCDLINNTKQLKNNKYDIILLEWVLHLYEFKNINRIHVIDNLYNKHLNINGEIYIQNYINKKTHLPFSDDEINIIKEKYNSEILYIKDDKNNENIIIKIIKTNEQRSN